jgi:hypothetical protein
VKIVIARAKCSTCSTRFAAVAHMRRPRQDGQNPRPPHSAICNKVAPGPRRRIDRCGER